MNFDFLQGRNHFKQLYKFCKEAEDFVYSYPEVSATASRKALETIVRSFYSAKYPRDRVESYSLFKLVQDNRFSSYVDDTTMSDVHLIRGIGNSASHGEIITRQEALQSLEALYYIVNEIMVLFQIISSYPEFDKTVYTVNEQPTGETVTSVNNTEIVIDSSELSNYTVAIKTGTTAKSRIDYTEAETRKIYIDTALKESGWSVTNQNGIIVPGSACVEIHLDNMPTESGEGYADYVLFDDDGKPLAVVEAKRTSIDPEEGRKQAIIYADCIEKKWNVRPVIFYTNGYITKIIENDYADRRVYGFYTKDELHSLMIRRSLNSIFDTRIDPSISDRPFIQEATTAVCEAFNGKRRKALLVMATGTGKTRCAISIVDVLQRCDWVQRVLFLADRTELVKQARDAFKKHLPNTSLCAISEESKEDRNYDARIIVSTYPTMINLIDCENRQFGIGHFDLIIFDEAHRSIYNKYKAIFNYFDSMMLGLTATPRERVESSTYDLFDLPKGEPTYYYDYETAVNEGYLVDYYAIDKTTQILSSGLRYDDLSEEEKEQYEELFSDEEGNIPEYIDSRKFYDEIINLNTVDKVLQTLMNEGLSVQGGDRLGKTIIFAQDHDHAQIIVERFRKLYPEKGNDFCQLVDYKVKHSSRIIEEFKIADRNPIIAVSVDKLDTGIDVPEVLNLVFFKRMFSIIKFWQMIGRGTRTCKDLNVYSPSQDFFNMTDGADANRMEYKDKQGFFIFDFCGNFKFFSMNPSGAKDLSSITLSQRLFELKTELVYELQKQEHQSNEEHQSYYLKWKNELIEIVKGLNRNLINVRTNLKYVDKYSEESSWEYLNIYEVKEIKKTIVPIIPTEDDAEAAKRFDLFVFNMELAEICGDKDYSKAIKKVTDICYTLLDKTTIPIVKMKEESLKEFVQNEYWSSVTISKLEKVRTEIRHLIYLLKKKVVIIQSDFEDKVLDTTGVHVSPRFKNYKQSVIEYLIENLASPSIWKIRNLDQIDENDVKEFEKILWHELGTKEEYDSISNGKSLGAFIRQIVGIEKLKVNDLFAEYLAKYNFNSKQEEFLHMIVNYVRENGDIITNDLINEEPFRRIEYTDLFGGNTDVVYDLINYLHTPIIPIKTV